MQEKPSNLMTIAVLGGSGKEGRGLAFRWARAGYRVIIGSRSLENAQSVAKELTQLLSGGAVIKGMSNALASQAADIVVLTVPYSAHREILESVRTEVQGKTLVDVTVPLNPQSLTKVSMPSAGSAAQEARQILGEEVNICTAFQNISYENLIGAENVDCDVLVTGTSKDARNETLKLVAAAGFSGLDAGPIENSVVVEGLTSILIYINKQFKSTRAGIRITGI
jgi:8-hydroxy-5-deazaflavin:NADPH oxidoreductase